MAKHRSEDWKVGDSVWACFPDRATGRYTIRGIGRVARIEPPYLILATLRSGEKRVGITDYPQFNTREAAEAYIAEHPAPRSPGQPMAHHTPPPEQWECLRCERVREGLPVGDVLDHTQRCPYRGTGRDPDVRG